MADCTSRRKKLKVQGSHLYDILYLQILTKMTKNTQFVVTHSRWSWLIFGFLLITILETTQDLPHPIAVLADKYGQQIQLSMIEPLTNDLAMTLILIESGLYTSILHALPNMHKCVYKFLCCGRCAREMISTYCIYVTDDLLKHVHGFSYDYHGLTVWQYLYWRCCCFLIHSFDTANRGSDCRYKCLYAHV